MAGTFKIYIYAIDIEVEVDTDGWVEKVVPDDDTDDEKYIPIRDGE